MSLIYSAPPGWAGSGTAATPASHYRMEANRSSSGPKEPRESLTRHKLCTVRGKGGKGERHSVQKRDHKPYLLLKDVCRDSLAVAADDIVG